MKQKEFYWSIMACIGLLFCSCAERKTQKTQTLSDSINQQALSSAESIVSRMEDTSNEYSEGLKSIEVNGKYGFVDTLGNIVIKPEFDGVGCFNEGLVSVCVGTTKVHYDVGNGNGDSATALVGGKYGFIDITGMFVVKPQYDYCSFFSQGVAVVEKNGKWGYIDKTGKEIIKLQYDQAEDFWDSKGFAAVSKDGKWGLIDIKGRIIIPLEHERASSTQNGVAYVFPFDKNIICYHVYNDGRIYKEVIKQ